MENKIAFKPTIRSTTTNEKKKNEGNKFKEIPIFSVVLSLIF